MSNPENYTVGWICAITTEFVATQAFLDERHDKPARVAPQDNNSYALGSLSGHNVVIAVLPQGEYGTNSAAVVARDMLHSFPNIRVGLMVGIGGGAPTPEHDIRLGDIVVSRPRDGKSGVLQYDFGKTIQSQAFQQTGFLNQPPQVLRTAVASLEAMYEADGHQLDERIDEVLQKKPRLRKKYSRPQSSSDRLYKSDIVHPQDTDDGCSQVCGNESSALVLRRKRDRDEDDDPAIHYGLVASANQLMKDARVRDKLAEENYVLCFEMEAAGLMNHFPCLVIRGICDYSDSHKNKEWQGFAAMAAAAYAKDLLNQISVSRIEGETRIEEVLKSLEGSINNIESTSNQIIETVKSIRSASRIAQIKDWLSPPDTSTNFNHARKVQLEGTGTWFMKSVAFEEWQLGSRRHLWLHSKPGCGKTVLCAKILHHLKNTEGYVALEFFFDFSDTAKQNLDDLLRSLIFKLYNHGGEAVNELDSLFNSCQSPQGQQQPETTALANTLHAMMKRSKKIYIVLDALDECTMREKLLVWIENIVSNPDFNHVQLLATSRPEEEFRRSIPVWIGEDSCKELNKESVTIDIIAYIEDRLQRSPEFKKFRWAACQLDSLEACLDREGIEAALQALPRDLNETYSRILQQIPQQRKMRAIRLLQFLVHSDRPLRLEEAVDVVAVRLDNGQRFFDAEDRLPCPADIMRFCPSLVSITRVRVSYLPGEVEEVQLAHFSVKEYLIHYGVEGFRHVEASISITHTCLTYLTSMAKEAIRITHARSTNVTSISEKEEEEEVTVCRVITQCFPLAIYATGVWMNHAKLAECVDEVVAAATVNFFCNTTTLEQWTRVFQPDRENLTFLAPRFQRPGCTEPSCLYFACLGGLTETAKQLILKGADVNTQGGLYGSALWDACFRGHKEVVQLLLSNGADVNAKGGHHGNALRAACFGGNIEVVQLLLSNGADVNDQGHRYGSALQAASYAGHIEVVQLLLRQVDVDSRDNDGRSTLSWAAEKGSKEMVQMLLNTGQVDVDSRDNDGRSTLSWAAEMGSKEMLINTGQVDVDSRDNDGRSVLSWAAGMGQELVLKMLLETQLDAVAAGKNELSQPACLSDNRQARDIHEQALDSFSAPSNKNAVPSWVLTNGVDINSKDNAGATPIIYGEVDAVRLLFIDPDSCDNHGSTPLSWAAKGYFWAPEERHEKIVSLLVASKRIDINSRDRDGYTPLMWALWRSSSRLLVQAGSGLSDTCKATLAFEAFLWKDADEHDQLMDSIGYPDFHDLLGLRRLFCDSCDE
ncbi:LOW QUALITY PROTEIN: uncharacterized protein LY79DRAFT_593036 [Colletotrichum navitas]|uniref:NACHT domain-containing protein n=1 Tax=Colletotrichum navitas TaxID=681940 RepID=A0AAD8PS51_9PEZI|nr:LOW QUALITY PROTEIN: uncharacterized protein LY79DRAFT_593036 [Colletotrichum navitas]KAK1579135.1 LOW QUALITY PROTEIN: hypothetical protein LY79DRAFT_593036 [Colletotrichum navitas]